jgi:NADP-dependent 3-hydroxy acid dehydrogenase YdfG
VATDIFGNVSGDKEGAKKQFIDGFELPTAKDIADTVAFAVAMPIAVNIGNIEITPTLQVPGGLSTLRPGDAG